MSEFTDYMLLHTAAESLTALEQQLVASVGAAEVPLMHLPSRALDSRAEADAAWGGAQKPQWLMLGTDAGIEKLARAGRAFHLQVEDDLQTWALAVHLDEHDVVFAFLRKPDMPREATVQYAATQIYDPQGNDVELAQIAEYFGVVPKDLAQTFVPDGGQAFSALIGAPYEQMEDLGWPGLAHGQVVFPFE